MVLPAGKIPAFGSSAEVKPKTTTWIMQESDLVITGYTLYSDLRGRGVALYVKDDLRSTEVESSTTDTPEASVWCSVPLINRDNLLVGVVYRSPNACITNNTLLNSMITEMVILKHSHVMIMGDFNYPDINWDTSTSDSAEDSPSQNFLSTYKGCFIYQHVAHPTHYRGLQQANILGLIMTNESDMIDKLHYTDPIGKSHHVVLD